ncbi:cyclin-dependent kinase inhibitor far1 [Haplosporangium bisporale]|nr:cyclin-dependent kinase inhibitor far1 [Haplosporangium bisporale]
MSSSDPLQALEFYTRNNVIFLTGGTGFVGKVILEKILRSLPQVQKIYMLMRASSKAAAQDRLEREVFGCRIFETIKAQSSNDKSRLDEIKRKVVPILGDLTFDCLGISPEDLEIVGKDTQTKVLDMVPVDVVVKTVLMAGPALVSKSPEFNIPPNTVPVIQMGTSAHCPLKVGYLYCHYESYWQQQPQFNQRLTDDIRVDFYSIPDFPRRYRQRFAIEIDLARASKEGAKKYGKMLRKAEVVPKKFLPFTCYEWFFYAKNGLWLDDVAPMELHSGFRAGIDWHKYLHNFNVGVHDYILEEAVNRTKEIHYELRTLHKDFVAAKDEVSDSLLRSRI